jgi:hypothetical protein
MDQLKQAVAAAFDKIVASGVIEQVIEKKLTETISDAIGTHLRSYGDFGKAIQEKVQQSIGVNLDRMDLPSYNDFVLKVIRTQMDAAMTGTAAKQLEENMAKLLAVAPAEITLEKLVNDFIEAHKEDRQGQEFTLLIERESYGFTYVCFDEDEGKSKYSCDFRIGITKDGEVFSLQLGGKDVSKTLFVGPIYGFERDLYQLYAAKTKIVVPTGADASDYDTSFPEFD